MTDTMEQNFEGLEMQKQNISTDRAKRVYEKCLSCLLPELWLLICQNVSFFVFSADNSNKSVTVWAKYSSASERSSLARLENAMIIKFWNTVSKISTLRNIGFWYVFVDSAVLLIFLLLISHKR